MSRPSLMGNSWGVRALWDKLPERHRQEDTDGLLEGFLRAVGGSLEELQRRVQEFPSLINPFQVPSAASQERPVLLGPVVRALGPVRHRGTDGSINAFGQFVTARGKFQALDVGDLLTISGSSVLGNNRTVTVVAVPAPGLVATSPSLPVDPGPLRWIARAPVAAPADRITVQVEGGLDNVSPGWTLQAGGAPYTVLARRSFPPLGKGIHLTEREGADGEVDELGRFSSPSVSLTQGDVGKRLSFRLPGALENDLWEIQAVTPTGSHALFSYLHVRGEDSNGGIIYSLLPGQTLEVVHVVSGVNTPLTALLAGDLLTVSLETGDTGRAVSTAAEVVTAARAAAGRRATITAGGDGTGVVRAAPRQRVPGRSPTSAAAVGWAMMHYPEMDLEGLAVPVGVVERAGFDLTVAGVNTLQVGEGVFAAGDVGKLITIRGSSSGNDGDHLVTAVPGTARLTVASTLTAEAGPLRWQLRAPPRPGNTLTAALQGPDLLTSLAATYGLTSDLREADHRRRAWVARQSLWVGRKGTNLAYEIVGALSGFKVSVVSLYRITPEFYALVPPRSRYELGDLALGRSGSDGRFGQGADGLVRLQAPSAAFTPNDVGRMVRISGAGSVSNNKMYMIAQVISSTEVAFRVLDTAFLPDVNNGRLAWVVLRLYTSLPPLLPRYDEMDADRMKILIDGNPPSTSHFGVDKFAWEADWSSKIGVLGYGGAIALLEATQISPVLWSLKFSGDCDVVSAIGNWRFIDAAGKAYWLESVPAPGPGNTWIVQVAAEGAPALGSGTFEYVCDEQVIPGYTLSSRLLVILEPGDILNEEGVALEEVYQRATDRLRSEVAAAKVEMVTLLRVTAPAVLRFGARIQTP